MDPLDRFRLNDRVAIVTGASSGLGRSFAKTLGAVGARLVLGARRVDLLEDLRHELEGAGTAVEVMQTDVCDPDDCDRLTRLALDTFGSVDVLVNNAGIARSRPSVSELPDQFRRVVDVNLFGTYWMAQACGRLMQPGSSIVNVSSLHGIVASRLPQAGYAASKAAVIGLTRDLASQWSADRGIRVNALCPGYFESEMTLAAEEPLRDMVASHSILGRFGRQEEIDSALLFLASDASSYMTGAILVVDGGYSAI
jgi:NAD(P)-dependent dehydrogenase (short-subunit alcohol dehydrogenase family)